MKKQANIIPGNKNQYHNAKAKKQQQQKNQNKKNQNITKKTTSMKQIRETLD